MKIVIAVSTNSDDCQCEEMTIDDKRGPCVYPLCECPEDAIIGRSLISCQDIADYMKDAYEAGKRGEEFSIEIVEGEE